MLEARASEFDDGVDEDKKIALLRLKNYIQKERNGEPFKIGFVFPMPGIRETVAKVFKDCGNGLEKGMVIAPCDVIKEDYDILVVDESHYTIGCIHTSQGYDMNYVGVIFGKEIDYDFKTKSIVIDLKKYKDKKVKAGTEESVLKELIVNTYTTILARGIKGCYVYAYNPNLRKYLKQYIPSANEFTLKEE